MELNNGQNLPIPTPVKKNKWWPGVIYPLLTIIFVALYSAIPALMGMTGKYARYEISHVIYHYAPYLFGVSILLLIAPFILIKFLFHKHHIIIKIAFVICVVIMVPLTIYSGIAFGQAGFKWINMPVTETTCTRQGGQWMTYWCNIKSKDFGKFCTDGSQCSNGLCYVDDTVPNTQSACYPYQEIPDACIITVTNGQRSTVCYDG